MGSSLGRVSLPISTICFSFSELEGRKNELDSDVRDDVRDDIEFSLFCC